jgi:hypothetical protein
VTIYGRLTSDMPWTAIISSTVSDFFEVTCVPEIYAAITGYSGSGSVFVGAAMQ